MKKFVLVDSWGHWWITPEGKKCMDCTVKGHKLVAESNDYYDSCLRLPKEAFDYREDGTWHTYRVEKRAYAKTLGLA